MGREELDAIVVGGGPAGSTCARFLVRAGLRVAVLDRAAFPRVKLCAGWLSAPVWDALEMSPRAYPAGLWEWNRCHVAYRGGRQPRRGAPLAGRVDRAGGDVANVLQESRLTGTGIADQEYVQVTPRARPVGQVLRHPGEQLEDDG